MGFMKSLFLTGLFSIIVYTCYHAKSDIIFPGYGKQRDALMFRFEKQGLVSWCSEVEE